MACFVASGKEKEKLHLLFFLVKYLKLLAVLFIFNLGYLLKVFEFERDSYFWNKSTLMLNLTSTLSELPKFCALICRNLPCPQKLLATHLVQICHEAFYFLMCYKIGAFKC